MNSDHTAHVKGKNHQMRLDALALAYGVAKEKLPKTVIRGEVPVMELETVIKLGQKPASSKTSGQKNDTSRSKRQRRFNCKDTLGDNLDSDDDEGLRIEDKKTSASISGTSSPSKDLETTGMSASAFAAARIRLRKLVGPGEGSEHDQAEEGRPLFAQTKGKLEQKTPFWLEHEAEQNECLYLPQRLPADDSDSDSEGLEKEELPEEPIPVVPFHGLLGRADDGTHYHLSTLEPFACICVGVSRSGKSHTMSVIAENLMIQNPSLNHPQTSMTALCLYYGWLPTDLCRMVTMTQPTADSKAAVEKIVVLSSPSFYQKRKSIYGTLPNVTHAPLFFEWDTLSAGEIRKLMGVDADDGMSLDTAALHELLLRYEKDGGCVPPFDQFSREYNELTPIPCSPPVLQAFANLLSLIGATGSDEETDPDLSSKRKAAMDCLGETNTMVIVDLTDPLLMGDAVNRIFSLIVERFLRVPATQGKLLLLDEGHKYLAKIKSSGSAGSLEQTLLNAIQQKRQSGLRIIMSSQDPLLFPEEILEQISFAILHRVFDENWVQHLKKFMHLDDSDAENVLGLGQGEVVISSSRPILMASPDPAKESVEISKDSGRTDKWKKQEVRNSSPQQSRLSHAQCLQLTVRKGWTRRLDIVLSKRREKFSPGIPNKVLFNTEGGETANQYLRSRTRVARLKPKRPRRPTSQCGKY